MAASTTTLYQDTNWQGSSEPFLPVNLIPGDVWPHSTNGPAGKDALANGKHPVQAIGGRTAAAGRAATSPVGVMVTYTADAVTAGNSRAVLNVAPGTIVKQYFANVTGYSGANTPNAWDSSLTFGQPVYVDDSGGLAAGVTLTLAPTNDAGVANVLAGWLWRSQTQEVDALAGGDNTNPFPISASGSATEYILCDILLKGIGG